MLAIDPKSETTIAVSCKEWKDQPPHTKDFNHMKELMDIEGIKHGIVAWSSVPRGIYPLIGIAEKNGYRFTVLDVTRTEELHNHMIAGRNDRIEDFFRKGLALLPTRTPTLEQEVLIRRTPAATNRTIHCSYLLPQHYGPDPPSYIRNAYFTPEVARLRVLPFLVVVFHAYREARIPGTGELLDNINRDVGMICDGITGKTPDQHDPIVSLLEEHFGEAVKDGLIVEEDFRAEVFEPKIDKQTMAYKLRVDAARLIEPLEVSWTTRRGDEEIEHTRTIEVTPHDLKEKYPPAIINVPIWNLSYHIGPHEYTREYFATTGVTLRDDMARCLQCEQPTNAICSKCGTVACTDHIRQCKTCGNLFCYGDSIICVDCKSIYCKTEAKGQYCTTCGGFVCTTDISRCIICDATVCNEHGIQCQQCNKIVCDGHKIEHRYLGLKKHFCSEKCQSNYDDEYKKKGKIAKLRSLRSRNKDI